MKDEDVGVLWLALSMGYIVRPTPEQVKALIRKLVEERARVIALENGAATATAPTAGDIDTAREELGIDRETWNK